MIIGGWNVLFVYIWVLCFIFGVRDEVKLKYMGWERGRGGFLDENGNMLLLEIRGMDVW